MTGESLRLAVAISFVLCCATYAWGVNGHKIVADIGYSLLSPTAKVGVDKFLNNKGVDLPEIAAWSDSYSHSPEGAWSAPMHYMDLPETAGYPNATRDCLPYCNIVAVENYTMILKNPTVSFEDKWFALKQLVHFVGDIHQPLHVGYTGDRGGNSINVTFFGELWNLHAVWDTAIIIREYNNTWAQLAEIIRSEMTASQAAGYASVLDATRMADGTFLLARTNAYNIPADHALADDYYLTNLRLIKKLLAMAGVRLSMILNGIFQ